MPLSPDMTVMQRVQVVEDALQRTFRHRYGFDVEPDGEGLVLWVVDPQGRHGVRTGIALFDLAREMEALL